MSRSRDLLSGGSLVAVAGWFLVTTGGGGGRVPLLVASVGCGVAGVAYLLAGADVDAAVAGRDLTPDRFRALAIVALGASILALGLDGVGDGLDALSVVLILGGLLAVAAGWLRAVRGDRPRPDRVADGES
ncbi:hypothetical protein [Halorubrum halodurans]|uniref:Uncharacterized protein n=1 Tax=Halorubrum halodurans TaxID=1383851 RepID=A0A256IJF1_9EURY|nr:hypothetical protein [Halorubrum halodurans]OYR56292.1 hypothetical protein DJ70_09640 [Halorubrum halodurans]